MLYANVNGEKVEARPKLHGKCPLCHGDVFSKCGEINLWHWAHVADENCDSWHEPETEWHKKWKHAFGKEKSEVIITKDRIKHIADVRTKSNVIIELQNSPIQKQTIVKREEFYGEQMLWIINGNEFKDNFKDTSSDITEEISSYNRFIMQSNSTSREKRKLDEYSKYPFKWSWPRKSWSQSKRDIFIDFGSPILFRIIEGMGTNEGLFKKVSKKRFLEKYGGDVSFLPELISSGFL
ncbi:MAG: hypothetical protein J0L83_02895 [Chitinophagales bacterium]|nr:hypothetical protein [Chitinophagales bacterium]